MPVIQQKFTHLHLHTPWSRLDGFCTIDDLIAYVKKMGMTSVGISDHGVCAGHPEFYEKCTEAGIKPILGMETYLAPNRFFRKKDYDRKTYVAGSYKMRTRKEMRDAGAEEIDYKDMRLFFLKQVFPYEEASAFMSDPKLWNSYLRKINRGVAPKSCLYFSAIPDERMIKHYQWFPRTSHMLLIAKTQEGYKNLITLETLAQKEGFYRKPHIDFELLKKYGKGLICTSACLGGMIPQLILNGHLDTAKRIALFIKSCVDEFYFEIQPKKIAEQKLVNATLIQWSSELSIPLVATTDAHMIHHEDLPIHAALTTIGSNEDSSDISVYDECYVMSPEEILSYDIPQEALDNAYKISEECNVTIEFGSKKFPVYTVPEGYNFDTYLRQLTYDGLFDLMLSKDIDLPKYQERLDFELKVVAEKHMSAYFLIVWDVYHYAHTHNLLTTPGRGSAAGALIAYLLHITTIDPIKYGLLFERFLNPERMAYPDCA